MSSDASKDLLSLKVSSNTFGTRLFENEFFKAEGSSNLYEVCRGKEDAWDQKFPDLSSLISQAGERNSRPKVAIATEDIVGPVRNGGIGTTYYYLAKLLVENGVDVSILYMRGNHSEKETIEHWVDHYAELGITFVPISDAYQKDRVQSNSQRWVRPVYNLYQFLKDSHFDIVHVSEWRGTSYMTLIAKTLGLHFSNTEFVVKCSSPWLWNRLYGSALIYNNADLTKMFFEKRSVELGDKIIGGSAHLIRWMISQGYNVKMSDTLVQPNVLLTDHLQDFIDARTSKDGDIVEVSELVFFGRLEERKGISEFCDAIDMLVEESSELLSKIKTISFMGKAGARLQSRPDISIIDYIAERTEKWGDIKTQTLTEFQQYEALSYLLAGDRLAVMPSRIENSSLAVYECLICGIPFIASYTGGTPELIDESYHDKVLFDTHPTCLAAILSSVLESGVSIPLATFDNDQNNDEWVKFHHSFDQWKKAPAEVKKITDVELGKVTVIIYHLDQPARLKKTIKSLHSQTYSNFEVLVVDDGSEKVESIEALNELKADGVKVLRVKYFGPGYAYNFAVSEHVDHTDYVFFTRAGNSFTTESALSTFAAAASYSQASLVTSFNHLEKEKVSIKEVDFIENQSFSFFKPPKHDVDILVSVPAFQQAGGFNSDPHAILETIELSNQLMLGGHQCLTVPEFLYSYDQKTGVTRIKRGVNFNSAGFRIVRPYLIHSPSILNNILLSRDPSKKPTDKFYGGSSQKLFNFKTKSFRKDLRRLFRRLGKGLYGVVKRFYKRNRYRLAKFAHTHIKPSIRKYPFLRWMEPPLKRILEKYRAMKNY